jgi:hypothetical protein
VKSVHEVAIVETNRLAIAADTHGRQNAWRPPMSKTMDSLVNLRWQQREDVFGIWTDRMTCMRPTEATAEVARMTAKPNHYRDIQFDDAPLLSGKSTSLLTN